MFFTQNLKIERIEPIYQYMEPSFSEKKNNQETHTIWTKDPIFLDTRKKAEIDFKIIYLERYPKKAVSNMNIDKKWQEIFG